MVVGMTHNSTAIRLLVLHHSPPERGWYVVFGEYTDGRWTGRKWEAVLKTDDALFEVMQKANLLKETNRDLTRHYSPGG
jgi:hypothetical protein